ncbi:hypothetical protein C1752_03479 [Acaryochloris thomasi RCC1774]|uniref:Uncharacterized protein n=1 Tax=Acaryochloris thomasi RCC1774 TaxID=1764569 RepID=A0A2W1JG39_9CYAN|nr:hypothetical protein [Acaryochloris thomasi]PZD72643.1 hypothetical protein C1752_03479 [Acaryochloris thomasi RCC1774]
MPQATVSQEEFGAIRENVRHNEKAIDEVKVDLKAFRAETQAEFKDVREELKSLSDKVDALAQRFDGLGWKALLGIVIIVAANVALKYL